MKSKPFQNAKSRIHHSKIDRSAKAVLAAAKARGAIYCLNPAEGWVLCGDGVYDLIRRIVEKSGESCWTLSLYGVLRDDPVVE